MEKAELKRELVKLFTETQYECAYIDDVFIQNFIGVMWDNILTSCKNAIKSGRSEIYIDDFTVGSYSGKFPAHERSEVYNKMLPHIEEELVKSNIPYTSEFYTFGKIQRFKIAIENLREFANVEALQSLI